MIYLDYSANTPVDEAVLQRFCEVERNCPGNANSRHAAGTAAKAAIDAATQSIARSLNVQPAEIIYTSGASEANNFAIKSIARLERHHGRHIISTPLEHSSVSGSLTAHKFYGLNGIGVLVKRRGLALEPLIHGGESTTIYRSGTPTVALACSLALALDKAMTELPERVERVRSLNARLRTELANYPKVRINSPEAAVPQILNLSVKDVKGTVFQRELDAHGVCVSVKSACSSDGLPSRAVFAVSRDRRNALSSWRISLSHRTTDEEITGFLQAFDACYRTLTQP